MDTTEPILTNDEKFYETLKQATIDLIMSLTLEDPLKIIEQAISISRAQEGIRRGGYGRLGIYLSRSCGVLTHDHFIFGFDELFEVNDSTTRRTTSIFAFYICILDHANLCLEADNSFRNFNFREEVEFNIKANALREVIEKAAVSRKEKDQKIERIPLEEVYKRLRLPTPLEFILRVRSEEVNGSTMQDSFF